LQIRIARSAKLPGRGKGQQRERVAIKRLCTCKRADERALAPAAESARATDEPSFPRGRGKPCGAIARERGRRGRGNWEEQNFFCRLPGSFGGPRFRNQKLAAAEGEVRIFNARRNSEYLLHISSRFRDPDKPRARESYPKRQNGRGILPPSADISELRGPRGKRRDGKKASESDDPVLIEMLCSEIRHDASTYFDRFDIGGGTEGTARCRSFRACISAANLSKETQKTFDRTSAFQSKLYLDLGFADKA